MEYEEQLLELLDELQKETGIRFSLSDNANDEHETLRKLTKLIHRYRGDRNKAFFLKEFLTEEIDDKEIKSRAKSFRINEEAPWSLIYIEFKKAYDTEAVSVLSSIYASGSDHMVEEDPKHLILLRQHKKSVTDEELSDIATNIHDTLETELMTSVKIAYDTVSSDFYGLQNSFKHAKAAMDIRNIFHLGTDVIGYHELGLGKLVYSLPKEACTEFIHDHLGDFDFEQIDSETRHTINVFFEKGLSIAETARELFVHRNTLVYRLDKLEKLTGLDIRRFSDAVTMEIALLMNELKKNNTP
ncbi:MAG: helix-turn-helix domain-containing protein [Lachnospiraceae bacterium]|nr:helix-turn-helix domain-containing protein [Lachnospiraceae bacterium]